MNLSLLRISTNSSYSDLGKVNQSEGRRRNDVSPNLSFFFWSSVGPLIISYKPTLYCHQTFVPPWYLYSLHFSHFSTNLSSNCVKSITNLNLKLLFKGNKRPNSFQKSQVKTYVTCPPLTLGGFTNQIPVNLRDRTSLFSLVWPPFLDSEKSWTHYNIFLSPSHTEFMNLFEKEVKD